MNNLISPGSSGDRFRSQTERKIASVLDRLGITYGHNVPFLVTAPNGKRVAFEVDFLIVVNGHLGVLEVDGEPFHPPERSAREHNRDRLLQRNGVLLVERYDAKPCWLSPEDVVKDFLDLMRRFYGEAA